MITVAIIGNPNVGKTELFNRLTGMKQHVGNWPGVTVEKKKNRNVHLQRRRDKSSRSAGHLIVSPPRQQTS